MKLEVRDIESMDDDAIEALAARLGVRQSRRTSPWTLAEAARELGVSRETLRLRIHAGEIARVPNIGALRIPAREMERLLEGGRP